MKLTTKISALLIAVSMFACSSSSSPDAGAPPGTEEPGPGRGNPGNPGEPGDPSPNDPNNPDPSPTNAVNPIEGASAAVQLTDPAETGFFDGPVWFDNALYFSNYDNNMIVKYFAGVNDPFSVARPTTAYKPVGAAYNQGQFFTTEVQFDGPAQVTSNAVNSPAAPVAITLTDGTWNSPNDLVFRADGSFYMTDPGYQQTNFVNRVYYITPQGAGTTLLVFNNAERPNGIALSIDEKTLYLSLTATGQVLKYAVNTDGSLGASGLFADLIGFNPDGITIDEAGNVYVANDNGVDVYAPDGKKWGNLHTDKHATAVAFGGADYKSLFVTAFGAVFQIDNLKVVGTKQ